MTIARNLAQGVGAVAPTHSSHPQSLRFVNQSDVTEVHTANITSGLTNQTSVSQLLILTSHVAAGALSRTNRTPRQQLQNKQAQQRYRERRKMKVTEMEQALAAMSQQVDELQGVLKQNVALQVQCSACICKCTDQTGISVLHLRFWSIACLMALLELTSESILSALAFSNICIHNT